MDQPKMKRVNLDDPVVMERMLRTGRIWDFPQFWQAGINAMKRGVVPLAQCKNVPAEVMDGFRK